MPKIHRPKNRDYIFVFIMSRLNYGPWAQGHCTALIKAILKMYCYLALSQTTRIGDVKPKRTLKSTYSSISFIKQILPKTAHEFTSFHQKIPLQKPTKQLRLPKKKKNKTQKYSSLT